MFQQPEPNNNTKEPNNVAEIELISYLREKPVLVNLDSGEYNTDLLEWWKDNTVCKKILAVKNFSEFGESQAIRQSFFCQFSKSIS